MRKFRGFSKEKYRIESVKDGTLTLVDMGLKFYGYCSDITCTYPVNGKFTQKQKEIYNAVLDATNQVKAAVNPFTAADTS